MKQLLIVLVSVLLFTSTNAQRFQGHQPTIHNVYRTASSERSVNTTRTTHTSIKVFVHPRSQRVGTATIILAYPVYFEYKWWWEPIYQQYDVDELIEAIEVKYDEQMDSIRSNTILTKKEKRKALRSLRREKREEINDLLNLYR